MENKILTGDVEKYQKENAVKWSRGAASTFFVEIMSEKQTAAEFFENVEKLPKQSGNLEFWSDSSRSPFKHYIGILALTIIWSEFYKNLELSRDTIWLAL